MQIEATDINSVMLARRYLQKTINTIESRDAGGLTSDLKGAVEDIDEWLDNAKEMTF